MTKTQIAIIQEDTAEKFQEAFNFKMSELSDKNPKVEFNHAKGYCAYIIYSDNNEFVGIVKPANRVICDTCLRCMEPPRRHAKWRKCELYGSVTRKDTKCSDYIPDGTVEEMRAGGEFYGN